MLEYLISYSQQGLEAKIRRGGQAAAYRLMQLHYDFAHAYVRKPISTVSKTGVPS